MPYPQCAASLVSPPDPGVRSDTDLLGQAIFAADALQRLEDLERAEPQGRIAELVWCSLALRALPTLQCCV